MRETIIFARRLLEGVIGEVGFEDRIIVSPLPKFHLSSYG